MTSSRRFFLALEELPQFHRWSRSERRQARRLVRWLPFRRASYWGAWSVCAAAALIAGALKASLESMLLIGAGQVFLQMHGTTIKVRHLQTLIAEKKFPRAIPPEASPPPA